MRIRLALFAIPALLCSALACRGQAPAADTGPVVSWDVHSFADIVQPLQHPLGKTPPLLAWNLPLPRDDKLVQMRADGSLREAIDIFAARGIVPAVEMGWTWTLPGALAMAKTLQEAGQPINILLPRGDLLEKTAYADCPITVEGPDASKHGAMRKWPCLWLARPENTTRFLLEQLQPFKDAGLTVAGLWFDDEALPNPHNGIYQAQLSTAECRNAYPPEIIANPEAFRTWALGFRAELFTQAIGPVRDAFPGIRMGNYGDQRSGSDVKYGLDASMPALYANTKLLPGAFRFKPISQTAVDRFYFSTLLGIFSAHADVKAEGKLMIPYVSRYTRDNGDPRWAYPMSQGPYRELLRHVFLRGADSLRLFNMGYPGSSVTTRLSFESVEDARVVLDEMLGYREFLDKGRPMNFAAVDGEGVVWSGLRLPREALIRVGAVNDTPAEVTLEPYPGVRVKLWAPIEGAWYIVARDGKVR